MIVIIKQLAFIRADKKVHSEIWEYKKRHFKQGNFALETCSGECFLKTCSVRDDCHTPRISLAQAPAPKGAVHKVRHAIFGQFRPPSPLSHFVTHPGTPLEVRHTSRTPHY